MRSMTQYVAEHNRHDVALILEGPEDVEWMTVIIRNLLAERFRKQDEREKLFYDILQRSKQASTSWPR